MINENNQKLFQLINANKGLFEISKTLKLSHKQVHYRINLLKDSGYNITRRFNDNGDTIYGIKKNIIPENKNGINLNLMNPRKFTAYITSDYHLGNIYEHLLYLDNLYEYIKENNEHIIINCGDTIDGPFSISKKTIKNPVNQLEYLKKKHPYDKDILNFLCLGNHEYDSAIQYGIDVAKIINDSRPDLVSLDYGVGVINIGNDQLIIRHKIDRLKIKDTPFKLQLFGHCHKFSINAAHDRCNVMVPTLSDILFDNSQKQPGALKMIIYLGTNGLFDSVHFEHLGVNSKVRVLSEFDVPLSFKKSQIQEELIEFPRESQINKFYRRQEKTKRLK